MAKNNLDQRVATLEAEVAELKAALDKTGLAQDWRSTVGMFTDDEGMKQLFAEAIRLREADRAKARRRRAKAKQ